MSTQDRTLQPTASDATVHSSSSLLARKSDEEDSRHVESNREDVESSGGSSKSAALTEADALFRLGIEDRHLPPGFTWSDREQAWVRDVSVDPMGKEGMTTADAEQLALLVDSFNSRVGAQALKARFPDSGEHAG